MMGKLPCASPKRKAQNDNANTDPESLATFGRARLQPSLFPGEAPLERRSTGITFSVHCSLVSLMIGDTDRPQTSGKKEFGAISFAFILPPLPFKASKGGRTELELFRHSQTLHPKYLALAGRRDDTTMPLIARHFQIREQILQFPR